MPLIDIKNVTISNVQQYGTILPPGVIRCNETNPCTGITFQNVKASGWWRLFGLNYITENIQGVVTDSKPVPAFNTAASGLIFEQEEAKFDFSDFVRNTVYPWISDNVIIEWDSDPTDIEAHHNRKHKFHQNYASAFKATADAFASVYRLIAY